MPYLNIIYPNGESYLKLMLWLTYKSWWLYIFCTIQLLYSVHLIIKEYYFRKHKKVQGGRAGLAEKESGFMPQKTAIVLQPLKSFWVGSM